jgi:hypothetical protein
LTRFLTRFPLLPQLAADSKTCSRIIASCAKSANASAASISVMFAAAVFSSPEEEEDDEQQLDDIGSNSIDKPKKIQNPKDFPNKEKKKRNQKIKKKKVIEREREKL